MVRISKAGQNGHFLRPQWTEECQQVTAPESRVGRFRSSRFRRGARGDECERFLPWQGDHDRPPASPMSALRCRSARRRCDPRERVRALVAEIIACTENKLTGRKILAHVHRGVPVRSRRATEEISQARRHTRQLRGSMRRVAPIGKMKNASSSTPFAMRAASSSWSGWSRGSSDSENVPPCTPRLRLAPKSKCT
jgi:hypothetical protein